MKSPAIALSQILILLNFISPVTSFAQQNISQAVSFDSSQDSIPACVNSDSDSDGDGWGWENNNTCHVGGDFQTKSHPICQDSNSDPDGDGWGWENSKSCKVSDEPEIVVDSITSSEEESAGEKVVDNNENNAEVDRYVLDLSEARKNTGFAYLSSGEDLISKADSNDAGSVSKFRFFEDGVEIGIAHSSHNDIRELGKGRFSDWQGSNGYRVFWFSTSDNSDPRTNGRTYTYSIEEGSSVISNTVPVDSEEDAPSIAAAQEATSEQEEV